MEYINASFKVVDHFADYYTEQVFGKSEQRKTFNKFFGMIMYLIMIPVVIIMIPFALIGLLILVSLFGF